MPDTGAPWNLVYPDSGDHTRTWEHWEALADSAAAALDAVQAPVDTIEEGARRMGVTLRRVATQAINDVVLTLASFDTQDVDTDNMWAIGTPTQVIIPAGGTGIWSATFTVTPGAGVANSALGLARVLVGATEVARGRISDNVMTVVFAGPLTAGDIVTFEAYVDIAAASTTMTARLWLYRTGI